MNEEMIVEMRTTNAKCKISCNSLPLLKSCSKERRVTWLWEKKRTKNRLGEWAVRVSTSLKRWSKVVESKVWSKNSSSKPVSPNRRKLLKSESNAKEPTAVEVRGPKWLLPLLYAQAQAIRIKITCYSLSQKLLRLKENSNDFYF